MIDTKAQEKRVQELEKQLKTVTRERDELQRDVEQLCLQSGSSMFSSSYVLSERVVQNETELKELRTKYVALLAEKDSLLEDMAQLKDAKHAVDKACQEANEQLTKLSRQLAFFEGQAAKALAERDNAQYQVEHMKTQALQLELSVKDLQGNLEFEEYQRKEFQRKLEDSEREVVKLKEELEARSKDAAQLPVLQRQLTAAHSSVQQMEEKVEVMKAEVDHSQKLLKQAMKIEDQLNTQLKQERAAHAEAQRLLHTLKEQLRASEMQVAALQAGHQQLEQELQQRQQQFEASAALDAVAQPARVSNSTALIHEDTEIGTQHVGHQRVETDHSTRSAHGSDSGLEDDIAALRLELLSLRAELDEKDELLAQARSATAAERRANEDDRNQMEVMAQMLKDMKIKLAQATQEKVEALLKAASLASTQPETCVPPSPGLLSRVSSSSSTRGGMQHAATAPALPVTSEPQEPAHAQATAEVAALQSQLAALNTRVSNLEELASCVASCLHQLQEAAQGVWGRSDAAKRWGAVTLLQKVQQQCLSFRSRMQGLSKQAAASSPASSATSSPAIPMVPSSVRHGRTPSTSPQVAAGSYGSAHPQGSSPKPSILSTEGLGTLNGHGQHGAATAGHTNTTDHGQAIDVRLAGPVLDLVSFAVESLEQFSKQSAVSSMSGY